MSAGGLKCCPDTGCRGHTLLWPTHQVCPWCAGPLVDAPPAEEWVRDRDGVQRLRDETGT